MLRLALSAVSALAISSAAFAADMYRADSVSLKDVEAAAPVNWTGLYIGGHVGGAFGGDDGKTTAEFQDDASGSFDDDDPDNFAISGDDGIEDGIIGGIHVGYNWQRYGSPLVLGVEGDLSFGDDLDYLASLRARVGFAHRSLLIYATAGVAFADFGDDDFDVKYTGTSTDSSPRNPNGAGNITDILPFGKDSDDGSEVGFVVGGGVEAKLRPNLSLGLEALYYRFDDAESTVTFIDYDKVDDEIATFTNEQERDFWVVRGRLTYHVTEEKAPLDSYK